MATGPNYPAVRAGIKTILQSIAAVQTAKEYEKAQNFGYNQLPYAMVWHQTSTRPALKDAQATLGHWDYTDTWIIHVYIQFQDDVKAQQDADTILSELRAAFDGNLLIDPNGPGVVDLSAVVSTRFVPLLERDTPLLLLEAQLETFIIT